MAGRKGNDDSVGRKKSQPGGRKGNDDSVGRKKSQPKWKEKTWGPNARPTKKK